MFLIFIYNRSSLIIRKTKNSIVFIDERNKFLVPRKLLVKYLNGPYFENIQNKVMMFGYTDQIQILISMSYLLPQIQAD